MTATTETGDLPVVTATVPGPATPTADEVSPANAVPTPPGGERATEVATASDAAEAIDAPAADADAGPADVRLADARPADAATVPDAHQPPVLLGRLRALPRTGLTGPGITATASLVLTPGVLLDLARDGSFGLASSVLFVLAALAAALTARPRALATAAVLPPLLFVGAVATLAYLSGNNEGSRELVLDVGTTLAVSAPLLYGGTAAALAVVLGRLVLRLVRR